MYVGALISETSFGLSKVYCFLTFRTLGSGVHGESPKRNALYLYVVDSPICIVLHRRWTTRQPLPACVKNCTSELNYGWVWSHTSQLPRVFAGVWAMTTWDCSCRTCSYSVRPLCAYRRLFDCEADRVPVALASGCTAWRIFKEGALWLNSPLP